MAVMVTVRWAGRPCLSSAWSGLMWLSFQKNELNLMGPASTVEVVLEDSRVGDLGGVVQPKLGGLEGGSEQMVLHGQMSFATPSLWFDGGQNAFE